MKGNNMRKQDIRKRQDEINKEINRLLAENSTRYNKMNSIAFDFFISELVGERDAKAEYKEQYYRAKETHTEILKLKQELREISDKLMERK